MHGARRSGRGARATMLRSVTWAHSTDSRATQRNVCTAAARPAMPAPGATRSLLTVCCARRRLGPAPSRVTGWHTPVARHGRLSARNLLKSHILCAAILWKASSRLEANMRPCVHCARVACAPRQAFHRVATCACRSANLGTCLCACMAASFTSYLAAVWVSVCGSALEPCVPATAPS